MTIDAAFKLPFAEQITFFQEKLNIPTERWDDIWKDMHAKGFMVAGAYQSDLLSDFRTAVDKAISKGTTLPEFRKDFDRIVETHGWSYNGGRKWRSELIYATNIRQSYQAGRWKQLTDPDVLALQPYLEYRHGDSVRPRPHHLAWNGTVLKADDPWWNTHYPQNGWGCKCKVFSAGNKEALAAKSKGKATAPNDGFYTPVNKKTGQPRIDPRTGKPERVPKGIDPGFDYNGGTAAFGKSWVKETGEVRELGPWRKKQYAFLPDKLTGDIPPVELGPTAKTELQLRRAVPIGIYRDKLGDYTNVTQGVADHIIADPKRWDGRERYMPLIPDTIKNAQEVWVGFMQFADSDRVFLRKRYVKAYEIEKGRVVGVLADTVKGQMVAFDAFHSKEMSGGRLRSGRLVYPSGE